MAAVIPPRARRGLAVAAIAAACAAAAAARATAPAAAEARPRYGAVLEATLLGAPVALDPQAAQSHAEVTLADLLFDPLYRVDASGAPQPHLAAGLPELDAARTTARIQLLAGARFHDGAPVTAADVVASLERLRAGPAGWPLAGVGSVRAVAPDAVELVLRAPQPALALALALPQAAVTRGGRAPGPRAQGGSGPFVLDAIDAAGRVARLRAADEHFAGRPYLDGVTLRWFDTPDGESRRFESGVGQVSARGVGPFATSVPRYLAAEVEGPAALLLFVGFGAARPELARNVALRRAIDFALPRAPLRSVTSGERVVPTRSPIPVEAGGAPLSPAAGAGQPGAAQGALALAARSARALDPAVRAQLELEILIEETRPDDRALADYVAFALHGLGLRAKITALPAVVWRERVARGACDLWVGQLAAPITHAPLWWAAAFAAGGHRALAAAAATGALSAAAAQDAFERELPILPLGFRAVRLWHRSDVRGLRLDALGRPTFADTFLHGAPARSRAVRP